MNLLELLQPARPRYSRLAQHQMVLPSVGEMNYAARQLREQMNMEWDPSMQYYSAAQLAALKREWFQELSNNYWHSHMCGAIPRMDYTYNERSTYVAQQRIQRAMFASAEMVAGMSRAGYAALASQVP